MKILHHLWRKFPADSRRYWLAQLGGKLAPIAKETSLTAPGIIIGGEIFRASGLGEGARIMQHALKKHHVPTWLLEANPYHFSLQQYKRAHTLLSSKSDVPLILHVNAPQLPYALLALPRKLLINRKIIGYWAWELPIMPIEWQFAFSCVHEIWVPSEFTAQAIRPWAEKKHKNVRVVPHALATTPLTYDQSLGREAFKLPQDALIVMVSFSLASSFSRKNPLGAIAAFQKAFGERQDRILLLKISHADHAPEDMKKIQAAINHWSNIILKTEILSNSEMLALTKAVDIVLSLHRSEGFGLVPAEAMRLGKAVIATNWSATTEFLDKTCGIPVDYRLIPVQDSRMVYQIPGAYWADADVDQAARALVNLADNRDYRVVLGESARKRINDKLGAESLINAVKALKLEKDSNEEAIQ